MEKTLRSSLQSSPQKFLLSASNLPLKSSKTLLKTLIHSIPQTSPLSSSLPSALHHSVSQSIHSFTHPSDPDRPSSPPSPPSKRPRRSSRSQKPASRSAPTTDSNRPILLKSLQVYTYIAHLCISHPSKPFQPSDLLYSVHALHDSLILFEVNPALMLEITGLCEEWWREGWPGRETLISQSLPFLVSRSLTEGKKVDVRRVCALRDAFSLFDFDDESIDDLKMLLVRCVIAPLYLKTDDGRRFLASLFGLNGQLVKEILALIHAQIPFGRKSMLEAYADVLFRAWKEGGSRDEIESGFLQGLVEGAIHASSRPLAASVRRILGGFINQRTTDGVEKVLFRLVEPVLFRSLQAANANVRQNALHLLLDMFPLEDPDATKEVKDTLLDKQFFLLEKLLVDDCPGVRVVAVEGCCRILHLFWEVIPSSTITKLLTKIINDMSHDICYEVRLSTLNGVIYLLDNPQTHEILKVLLPRLGFMFLDPILSVRVAVADLLLALIHIPTFQFNKVVGLEALLSSLSNDHPLVAKRITRLLIPSYFPSKVTPKEACNRCVALIRRSPTAGARFCEFALSEGSSPKPLMELVRFCVSLSLSPDGLNPDQIDGFSIAAANICSSLLSEASNKMALNELITGKKLKRLLSVVTSERAHASVLNIASMTSPDNAAWLLEQSMDLLRNCVSLSENVEKQAEVRAAHKLVLFCGRFDDFFEALVNHLQRTASRCHTKFGSDMPMHCIPTRRKKVKLSVKTSTKSSMVNGKRLSNCGISNVEGDYVIAAVMAWQIKDLLVSVDTRNAVLNSPISDLALSALKVISQVNIEQCIHCEFLDTSPVLAYTSLATHMALHNVDVANTSDVGDNERNSLHSTRISPEQSVLNQALTHLLNCTERLFRACDPGKSSILNSDLRQGEKMVERRKSKRREALADVSNTIGTEPKPDFPEIRRISNTVKMVTTVLKFVVDAATVRSASLNKGRELQFTSSYVQYIITTLDQHPGYISLSEEEDLKDIFLYLKSSFTYAAKLLNLVLKNCSESSPPSQEASYLANNLLNLITSIELHVGSSHVLIKAAKEGGSNGLSNHGQLSCPTWAVLLGKAELNELSELSQEEETCSTNEMEFSVFKRLIGVAVLQLKKGNLKILDAVGAVILNSLTATMESRDFGLVFGLVHFVCIKMVGPEYGDWKELELVSASLKEMYIRIEKEIQHPKIGNDGRHRLESAKALIESVGMGHG
ncbi:uncharacterized protein LOC131229378 isoform X2 [Magnolia sinica]|uniref:uncharacterized protein LOC131229378 isoform X2 n=1 Tax=Magnolia sinica TaxID=86752 RepID=UPI00265A8D21|nr:uncharacterized protein LOC131229378 isoform X2 [Magnolia sinica]